jgi:glycosyltransferase involved in cell wall biosynthesis
MRFCMLSTFYPPHHFGGDALFVRQLSLALAKLGHDVDVFYNLDAWTALKTTDPRGDDQTHPRIRPIPLRSPLGFLNLVAMHQTGRPWGLGRGLRTLFAPGRYDVIHYHNISLLGAPEILNWAKHTDAVTLVTLHDHWLVCPTHVLWRNRRERCERQTCLSCQLRSRQLPQAWRYSTLRDRALEAVDAVLAPSRFTLERHRAFGLKREMVHLPHFCPDLALEAGTSGQEASRPFFLYSGRLETLKGPQTLVEVFRTIPEADLVVAGGGHLERPLATLSAGASNIRFVGQLPQQELVALYRTAQAVIVPSLCHEVFGLATIEAFAASTPVIVRRLGALPELIEEGRTGYGYTTDAELRRAIHQLCGQATRTAMGRAARAAYEARWTETRHMETYLTLIARQHHNKAPRPVDRGRKG